MKNILEEKFKIKDLQELYYFLRIEIMHLADGVWLSQYQYAMKLLKNFGLVDCKGISTPLDQNTKILADVGPILEDSIMYRKILGGLIYLMITHQYLGCAMVSQFMQNAQQPHLDYVKRILGHVEFARTMEFDTMHYR